MYVCCWKCIFVLHLNLLALPWSWVFILSEMLLCIIISICTYTHTLRCTHIHTCVCICICNYLLSTWARLWACLWMPESVLCAFFICLSYVCLMCVSLCMCVWLSLLMCIFLCMLCIFTCWSSCVSSFALNAWIYSVCALYMCLNWAISMHDTLLYFNWLCIAVAVTHAF